MDISQTTAPKSDQQNFDDYISGPKTVTISEVRAGSDEQPVDIHLVEFPGRPFKPSKSMRRVLVAAWGPDASAYVGRRMVLFGDPTIRFGGAVVGGIRISNLSHIDKPLTISLTTTRGKRAPYVVKPLASEPATILPVNPPKQMVSAQQLSDLAKAFEANGINDRAAGLACDRRAAPRRPHAPAADVRGAAPDQRAADGEARQVAAFHDTDSRRNSPGLPDLVLLHPETGQLLFVELKSATGRIRPEQQQWIDALHRGGHTVRVWRPEQWHDGTIARALVTERGA
jgi:hypothetical protein